VYQQYARQVAQHNTCDDVVSGQKLPIFLFELIFYIDGTNLDKSGKHTLSPLVFSSTLFKEKSRRLPEFWQQLGYVVNSTQLVKQNDYQGLIGQSTRNMHAQLEVLLDGLHKLQSGEDTRLDDVLLNINNTSKRVSIKCPISYIIADAVEGDGLCGHFKSNSLSVQRHYRVCTCPFDQLSNPKHRCTRLRAHDVETLVDTNNADALHEMSQYYLKSAFFARLNSPMTIMEYLVPSPSTLCTQFGWDYLRILSRSSLICC